MHREKFGQLMMYSGNCDKENQARLEALRPDQMSQLNHMNDRLPLSKDK